MTSGRLCGRRAQGLPCVERPSLYCYDLVAEGAAAHALPASVLDAEFELVRQPQRLQAVAVGTGEEVECAWSGS